MLVINFELRAGVELKTVQIFPKKSSILESTCVPNSKHSMLIAPPSPTLTPTWICSHAFLVVKQAAASDVAAK